MYFQKAAIGLGKRDRTRGLIIDSAIEAFSREGINGARISRIAEQAGVTGATFYNHFRDKEELTAATAGAIILELNDAIGEKVRVIPDPVTRVVALCACVLKVLLTHPNWAMIVVESFHYLRSIRGNVTAVISQQIDAGIKAGRFSADLDDFLLEQVAALVMSSIRNQVDNGYDETRSALTCEHVLRLLGLTPREARTAVKRFHPELERLDLELPGQMQMT